MTQSLWSKGTCSSSSICLDNCPAEHLPPFVVPSISDASNVSLASYKDRESMKMLPDGQIYSSGDTASGLLCFNQTNLNSSRESNDGHLSMRRYTSPAPYAYHDWNLNTGHQAKRARVENIIKGMTCTDVTTKQHKESDYMQEDEANQEVAVNRKYLERSGFESTGQNQGTRKQLERQHQHLRQLRTKFGDADGGSDSTNSKEGKYPSGSDSSETSPGDEFTDSCNEYEGSLDRKYQGWKKVKLLNYFQSKPERIKLMADVLKCELSRAVSRSIDSIFKSMPLLQTSTHDAKHSVTTAPLQLSESIENKLRFSCCGTADMVIPDVQTEALSLVVQKPELERPGPAPNHHPKSPIPFSHVSALHEDQTPERNPGADYQHALRCLQDGCSEGGQTKFDWNSTKVKSKVSSRSVRSPHTPTVSMDPMLLESLCLPHVKIESDSMVKSNLYMLNEGLTTNHLKKAKLMFFYTRYPSSLVLRMCFHDVQFTRCITSQLIKWFSNFREFYYIQMEKFARSALMEGLVDVRDLTVGRESELFRALNMHYNKANDYQVPERFLEVAEITLREFYIAISTGKDRDPSWKKGIYKVICKLDSDVPAEFKLHHSA
ncbi:prospero homeobox protein 1-like [Melanotaenia boesemani]|uniref:prospero homeobox protein 1-like n=1 Tax=Melanotaenia boesemani TaxID=1250792 RepID=UPI001C048E4F|nr:prospero homeobox protein 1-like [Melanotaenia boesemani]